MLTRIIVAGLLAAALWTDGVDAQGTKRHHSTPPAAAGKRGTHRLEIVNHESATIVSIYVSPARDDDWGDDLLGDGELDAGAVASFSLEGPCRADIRIDFEDASESRRNVDLCRFPSLTIEPGWTLKPLVAA